ncbi:DUF5825 family protein [Streptomyces sp. HUAS MG47]|uniref:DUF5825 family protein n=1 Tax=Streptomyces solicamelliae TaxID=3231716 RepID=UPI003877DF64
MSRTVLPLGAGGRDTADAVRLLRDCQSAARTLRWAPDTDDPPFDTALLHHLPPPETGAPAWRERYAYGLLYHRRGPGFVTVMDRRDPAASARFTLDAPALVEAFLSVQEPAELDALDASVRESVALLAEERLVLVTDGWAVALPPRLRRWPVPCTSV